MLAMATYGFIINVTLLTKLHRDIQQIKSKYYSFCFIE